MAIDVRADRHSNSLLDLEGKILLTEYIYGDEEEVSCEMRSVKLSSWGFID